jgi:hypothetical protein
VSHNHCNWRSNKPRITFFPRLLLLLLLVLLLLLLLFRCPPRSYARFGAYQNIYENCNKNVTMNTPHPQPGGSGPRMYSSRHRVPELNPWVVGSLFVARVLVGLRRRPSNPAFTRESLGNIYTIQFVLHIKHAASPL